MVRAVGENTFQPKIGFKTRYGIVANPFAEGTNLTNTGRITKDSNRYYQRVTVNNLM
jgi:beta-glucosidase/6-phospho-beta-glucosidase/beta-galactosidase